jgi:hypothetical protein
VVAALEAGDVMNETDSRLTVVAEAKMAQTVVAEAVAEVEAEVEMEAIPTKEEEVDQALFKELALIDIILLKSMLQRHSHPKICPSYLISGQHATLQKVLVQ